MTARRLAIALLLVSTFGFVSCSSDDDASDTTVTTASGVQATAVSIDGFAFSPSSLRAKVGDTITVTNRDDAAHTLTAKDGSFDTGTLTKGQSATITFTKAGTFDFICSLHPSMTGTVTVG